MGRVELLIVLVCIVLFLLISSWTGVEKEDEAKEKFMNECLTEHKQYMCDVLWGKITRF